MRCACYCAQRSIRVVGDIAIFVDYDSADVWSHRDLFRLRKDNFEPEAVSGVPPDAFSATGQRWGSSSLRLGRDQGARLRLVD